MVILIDGVRYRLSQPENEAALEKRIEDNHKQIFGEDSFYFPKKLIKSKAGIGTIPDAYAIYFDNKPKWAVIEVELASHPVYDHVLPQLTKFRRALESHSSRRKIADFFYERAKADPVLEAKIKKQIGSGEVFKFFTDLVADDPMLAVIIDERTEQLEEALLDFGRAVKVVEFKTFRREGILDEVNAYFFEPIVNNTKKQVSKANTISARTDSSTGKRNKKGIGAAIFVLFDNKGVDNVSYEECEIVAREAKPDTAFDRKHFAWYKNDYRKKNKQLPIGLKLFKVYQGIELKAEVAENNKIIFDGELYSPSFAARAAVISTGLNENPSINGWDWWKFIDPDCGEEKLISVLR